MPRFGGAVIETPSQHDPREWRCMASICQVRGYGHGHPPLAGRPVWSFTWLERDGVLRTRRARDYCSPQCREYGSADTIALLGQVVPGSDRQVDPPLNEHAVG